MFRRVKPPARKEEVHFPADLKQLGYFVNEHDQIRSIKNPEQPFKYRVHKVERVNERRREAVDECVRRILDERFAEEGFVKEYFPPGSDPAKDRCVPILVDGNLESDAVEKVLIVVGNTYDDLGIWSVREMEGPGVNHGSMVSTVQTAKAAGFHTVILNCGQNVYSPEVGRAVTYRSWRAATHDTPHIDEVLNRIPRNENVSNHVVNVLDELKGRILLGGKSKRRAVYFLTYGWGCWAVVKYLNKNFDEWKDSLEALIAVESAHTITDITNPALAHFIKTRARAYIVHADPPGSFIPDRRFGCQTFSTGEIHSECIIPNHWMSLMLPWLVRVEQDPEGCNPVFAVDWAQVEKLQEGWGSADVDGGKQPDEDKWSFDDDDDMIGRYEGGDKGVLEEITDLRDDVKAARAQMKQENIAPGEMTEFGGGKAAPTA
ncbi:hypothetical protein TWF696_005349 [Orbilia brochopaga]|uniref:Arb2 domain-containing protein n=1 Tax=Orbilia brochopaga TaxID=3140254 RepID=A0AAV9V4F2_9PEZI